MMKNKKIGIIAIGLISMLMVGILIGFFIGKSVNDKSATEPSTTHQETTEEQTTEEEISDTEITKETTTKKAQYREVDETVYATANVNIRKSASTSSDVIGGLKKGENIKRIAVGDNGWSKVTYNGKTAFIASEYLAENSFMNGHATDFGGISNTDMNNLEELTEYILFYGLMSGSYNSNSDDAFEKAFSIIHGVPFRQFSDVVAEIYRMNYESFIHFPQGEGDTETDPRGYWPQYRYVEEHFIDLILEEMFNVKPNHNYVLYGEEFEGKKEVLAYYEDGLYYSAAWDGGDGCGPDLIVKEVKALSDGKYQIIMNYRIVAGGDNGELEVVEDCGDYMIIAEMKPYEGLSLWSFYEIKEIG